MPGATENLKVSYYPGCSLTGTAREFDVSARAVCRALGVDLLDLPDWNCCGATSAHALNQRLAISLPARNLTLAEQAGRDLIIPCAACFNRMKAAERVLASGQWHGPFDRFQGRVVVHDLLHFLAEAAMLDRVAERRHRPLSGLKVACYYGCLITRPPKITGHEPENPQAMESMVMALGAEPVRWGFKTECCGGSFAASRPDIVRNLVTRLYRMAVEAGAECLAVACPLCHANLDMRQQQVAASGLYLPVFYFTELLGMGLGLPFEPWLADHFVDPRRLLHERGLLP
ncbi:MAG: CoB--CoM heterodisulfide reductase iron-sulfur subunit B family protein [Pseudomonadota bacterium]